MTLHSTYFHLVGAGVKAGQPPAAVRADLTRPFRVAVVYTGSGSETIAYKQPYKSVCAGAGGFTDEQDDTVTPMSWSVRYVVDLDDLQSAVRGPAGTVLVPDVGFYRSQSRVTRPPDAHAHRDRRGLQRRADDVHVPDDLRARAGDRRPAVAAATGGLEVGVPITSTGAGDCDPSDYTLGPSLWDSGATTAFVDRLGLVGGTLPTDPYAPVKVSWPTDGVALSQGFIASPCQGDGLSCRDAFHWSGQVALQPVSAERSLRAGTGLRHGRRGRLVGTGNRRRLRGIGRRAGIGGGRRRVRDRGGRGLRRLGNLDRLRRLGDLQRGLR